MHIVSPVGFQDQFFANRRLEQVAVQCSFVEAYVGGAYGYVQVTRANGKGPVLLVLPQPGTSFEAWRPLRGEDRSADVGFGFEGHHEMMLHSRAWADDAWREAQPWVAPTSLSLRSGQHVVYGVRLLLAPGPQEVRRRAGRGATKQGSSHHHMSRLRMHHYQGIAPQLNWN